MNKSVISHLQSFGFDVYMRDPNDTYLLFTDGKNIGYLQTERLTGGLSFSTLHKANSTSGTGFQACATGFDFTEENARHAFMHSPHWAANDHLASVVKYRDMAEYLAENSFNGGHKKIAPATEISEA